jgi:hypothetical protein
MTDQQPNRLRLVSITACALAAITLAACGGGGDSKEPVVSVPEFHRDNGGIYVYAPSEAVADQQCEHQEDWPDSVDDGVYFIVDHTKGKGMGDGYNYLACARVTVEP